MRSVTSSPSSSTRSPSSSRALRATAAGSPPSAAAADRAVHRAGVEVREAEPLRGGAGDGGLAGPGGPVDGDDHGRRRVGRAAEQALEVGGEAGVGDRGRLHPDDLDALARREPGDRAEHRQPVVAVGVASRRRAGRRCRARRSRPAVASMSAPRPRRPSTTVAMRSVSLSRSSPAPRTIVSPSAKQPSSATSGSSSIASGTSSASTTVAPSGESRDVELGDRLGRRDAVLRLLERADDDRAHALRDAEEADARPVRRRRPRARSASPARASPRRRGRRPTTGRRGRRCRRPRARPAGARSRMAPSRSTRAPACAQHPLGVVAARRRLDARSSRPRRAARRTARTT